MEKFEHDIPRSVQQFPSPRPNTYPIREMFTSFQRMNYEMSMLNSRGQRSHRVSSAYSNPLNERNISAKQYNNKLYHRQPPQNDNLSALGI